MPSTVKSDKWFLRVTLPHAAVGQMWAAALKTVKLMDMTRCLAVGHIGSKTEKEHVHFIIEMSKVLQKQSFDVRIKSIFGVSGADYSSKPWDGGMEHGAGSYLYHDPVAVEIYRKGFTDDEVTKFRECNDQVQAVVEENRSRASGRCVERTLTLIKESNTIWSRKQIAYQLLTDIREDKMYECGDFVLRKYLEEIYMKQLSKDQWIAYAELRTNVLVRSDDVEIYHPIEHNHETRL